MGTRRVKKIRVPLSCPRGLAVTPVTPGASLAKGVDVAVAAGDEVSAAVAVAAVLVSVGGEVGMTGGPLTQAAKASATTITRSAASRST
jgi:hypothetical protein